MKRVKFKIEHSKKICMIFILLIIISNDIKSNSNYEQINQTNIPELFNITNQTLQLFVTKKKLNLHVI